MKVLCMVLKKLLKKGQRRENLSSIAAAIVYERTKWLLKVKKFIFYLFFLVLISQSFYQSNTAVNGTKPLDITLKICTPRIVASVINHPDLLAFVKFATCDTCSSSYKSMLCHSRRNTNTCLHIQYTHQHTCLMCTQMHICWNVNMYGHQYFTSHVFLVFVTMSHAYCVYLCIQPVCVIQSVCSV